ncbi:MAG: hypothetical protein CSB46_11010, partial [Micrococcales bacterium]
VVSGLEPEEFGQYYATGHQYKSKGQAVFFEVDPDFRDPYFDIDEALARCVPHPDGKPKNSVYVSVYRVLEHLPVSALRKLYLATSYGHTLGLEPADAVPPPADGSLAPQQFYAKTVYEPEKLIAFPALCFVELGLGALATNPQAGQIGDLPYDFIHHLREALLHVTDADKHTKLVHRVHAMDFPYRMVQGGFYVGNGRDLAFYPMPSHSELRSHHHAWWRSANS